MTTPLFGHAARLQAQTADGLWVRLAGGVFWWGLIATVFFWWNGWLDPQEAPKQILLGISMVLVGPFLFMAWRRAGASRPLSWMVCLGLMLLAISAVVSWVVAADHWLAFFGVAGSVASTGYVWMFALVACMYGGTLRVLGWRPSLISVYTASLILVGIGGIQRLGWIDLSPGGPAARVFSPVGNELALAWLIGALTLIVLAYEAMGDERVMLPGIVLRRLFFLAGMAFVFFVDPPLFWPVWLTCFVLIIIVMRKTIRGQSLVAVGFGLTLFVGLVGWFWHVPQPAHLPSLAILTPAESWRVVRLGWNQTHLLSGAGLGEWSRVFELVRPVSLNLGSLFSLRFDTGGAFWWTILLQQGVLGGLAWLLFFVIVVLQFIVQIRNDQERFPLAIGIGFGFIALFFLQPPAWMLVVLFAVLGYGVADRYEVSPVVRQLWGAKLLSSALVTLMFIPYAIQRVRADGYLRETQSSKTVDERRRLTQQAVHMAPWLPDTAFAVTEADAAWIQERIHQGVGDPTAFQQELAASVERIKAANTRWPLDPGLWLARGGLYAAIEPVTQGADQFALQAYQEGMKFAPHHPGFPLGMARVFLQRASHLEAQAAVSKEGQEQVLQEARLEQLRLAAQWFRRALEQKPDDRTVRYALALTLARAGDLTTATPLFEVLWSEDPNQSDMTLEYATVLAAGGRRAEAIKLAQRISSQDSQYMIAQRLLVSWYEAEHRWSEALAALRTFPLSEQQTPAFRQRVNRVQSQIGASSAR